MFLRIWEENDKILGETLCKNLRLSYTHCDILLEGGALVYNDLEIAILTDEYYNFKWAKNYKKNEIENILKKYLNLEKIVWIKNGLKFDETNGHADEVAAFKSSNEILLSYTDDKNNPNYQSSHENYQILKQELPDYKIPIPFPLSRKKNEEIASNLTYRSKNSLFCISYINYFCGKDYLILPIFHLKEDKHVLKIFKEIFPNKKIIPFYAREIFTGGGGIHCISKNI